METAKMTLHKMNFEKTMITLGMTVMECMGFLMLVCGILDIKIF